MQYLFIVFTGLQGPLLFFALIVFQDDAKANTLKLIETWCTPRKDNASPEQNYQETAFNTNTSSPSPNEESSKTGIVIDREKICSGINEERNEDDELEEHIYGNVH